MPNQDYQTRLHKAEALYAEGNTQQALDAFVQLNSLYPDNPEVLNNLGVVSFALGQLEQAREYLDQATTLDPDFQEAIDNLQGILAAIKEKTPEQVSVPQDHFPIQTRDGITVCTPPTVKNMTSFVLLEQEDWFEPEIEFVRRLVQPGMTMLDIGAGFGVYALPVAKAVGHEGKVYAFEPNPEVRNYLNKSRETNSLGNLEIISLGLSDTPSSGALERADTPELSTILLEQSGDIELTTLDVWWQQASKPDIDFIKLNVNGKEANVISGGQDSLAQTSPIVLFCIGQGNSLNQEAIQALQDLGYAMYRYLPGPKVLVPFDPQTEPDPSLLKLVAVKPDNSSKLQEMDLLAPRSGSDNASVPEPKPSTWQGFLSELPWTKGMQSTWEKHAHKPEHSTYLQALNCLCAAQLPQTPAEHKPALYHTAANMLADIVTQDPSNGSAGLTLARAMYGLDLRSKALQAVPTLQKGREIRFNLPFLPPLEKLDHKPMHSQVQNWIMACCLESLIAVRHFSGYFTGQQDQEIMKILHKNPEHSVESERRLALLRLRNDNKDQIDESSLFYQNCEGNRNRWFWEQYIKDNHIRQLHKVTELPSELIAVLITLQNGSQQTIKIPRDELFRIKNVFQNNEYALPRRYKPPEDMTVVDIGANVGTFAIYAKQWAKNVHVYCYEPNSQVLNILKENLQSYRNIYQYPVALSDKNGEFNLYLHPKNTGQTSLTQYTEHCSKVKVPVKHAGKSIKEIGLTNIDVLKIDTEGSEVQVIKAIKSILPNVAIVMLEYHSEKDRRIIDNLLIDFFLYDSSVMVPGVGTMKYYNKAIFFK